MPDAIEVSIRRVHCAIRANRQYRLLEAWDLNGTDFISFVRKNRLEHEINHNGASMGFYRPDPNKPWSISNIAFDAKLAVRTPRTKPKQSKRPAASPGAVVLTKAEWIDELRQSDGLKCSVENVVE